MTLFWQPAEAQFEVKVKPIGAVEVSKEMHD